MQVIKTNQVLQRSAARFDILGKWQVGFETRIKASLMVLEINVDIELQIEYYSDRK